MTADIVSLSRYRAKRDRERLVDPVIAHWRCRVGVCLVKIGVTQLAFDVLELFNAELRRRREKPITEDECMVCPDHTSALVRSRW